MWGDINFYLSGRTHSSGLFHLHTNNCNLHSSIGHIKPLAYSLQHRSLKKCLYGTYLGRGGMLLIILFGGGNDDGIPPVKLRE